MEIYFATEILLFVSKWMVLEEIMLNEISQTQKDKQGTCLFYICGHSNKQAEFIGCVAACLECLHSEGSVRRIPQSLRSGK